jgi:serine/threonine protein kinase
MIPVLDTVEEMKKGDADTDRRTGYALLQFLGSLLINCSGLSFDIIHSASKKNESDLSPFQFDTFVSDWEARAFVRSANLAPTGRSDTVSIRLRFMGHGKLQASPPMIWSEPDVLSPGPQEQSAIVTRIPWWIYIVVAVCVALFLCFVVILVVTVVRRRKKRELFLALGKDDTAKEDEVALSASPIGNFWVGTPRSFSPESPLNGRPVTMDDGPVTVHTVEVDDESNKDESPTDKIPAEGSPAEKEDPDLLNAVVCEPPFAIALVRKRESLYDILHDKIDQATNLSPHLKLFSTDPGRARFLSHITIGIDRAFQRSPAAPGLRDLSSFHVFPREGLIPALCLTDRVDATPEQLLRWKAPELMKEQVRDVSHATLVYAVGMLLFELLTGNIPFASCEGPALLETAENMEKCLAGGQQTPLWELLKCCVETDPVKRISLSQLSSRLAFLGQQAPLRSPEEPASAPAEQGELTPPAAQMQVLVKPSDPVVISSPAKLEAAPGCADLGPPSPDNAKDEPVREATSDAEQAPGCEDPSPQAPPAAEAAGVQDQSDQTMSKTPMENQEDAASSKTSAYEKGYNPENDPAPRACDAAERPAPPDQGAFPKFDQHSPADVDLDWDR